jgi:hypothetical protein
MNNIEINYCHFGKFKLYHRPFGACSRFEDCICDWVEPFKLKKSFLEKYVIIKLFILSLGKLQARVFTQINCKIFTCDEYRHRKKLKTQRFYRDANIFASRIGKNFKLYGIHNKEVL